MATTTTRIGCSRAGCWWEETVTGALGWGSQAETALRKHMETAHPEACACNASHDGPCPPARVDRASDVGHVSDLEGGNVTPALLQVAPAPGVAGAIQMWGVVETGGKTESAALALFPTQHAAWRWLLNIGRDTPPRGKFGPSADAFSVRPFMVAAARLAE
jgi:hypothetical protein